MSGPQTILIVEDYEDTRSLLRMLLEGRGYRAIEAGDIHDALDALKTESPDMILMDINLPAMDGLTATRLILHQKNCRIPIIAVSAMEESEYRRKAIEAGCVEFVPKPVDFAFLISIIEAEFNQARVSN